MKNSKNRVSTKGLPQPEAEKQHDIGLASWNDRMRQRCHSMTKTHYVFLDKNVKTYIRIEHDKTYAGGNVRK